MKTQTWLSTFCLAATLLSCTHIADIGKEAKGQQVNYVQVTGDSVTIDGSLFAFDPYRQHQQYISHVQLDSSAGAFHLNVTTEGNGERLLEVQGKRPVLQVTATNSPTLYLEAPFVDSLQVSSPDTMTSALVIADTLAELRMALPSGSATLRANGSLGELRIDSLTSGRPFVLHVAAHSDSILRFSAPRNTVVCLDTYDFSIGQSPTEQVNMPPGWAPRYIQATSLQPFRYSLATYVRSMDTLGIPGLPQGTPRDTFYVTSRQADSIFLLDSVKAVPQGSTNAFKFNAYKNGKVRYVWDTTRPMGSTNFSESDSTSAQTNNVYLMDSKATLIRLAIRGVHFVQSPDNFCNSTVGY